MLATQTVTADELDTITRSFNRLAKDSLMPKDAVMQYMLTDVVPNQYFEASHQLQAVVVLVLIDNVRDSTMLSTGLQQESRSMHWWPRSCCSLGALRQKERNVGDGAVLVLSHLTCDVCSGLLHAGCRRVGGVEAEGI